MTIDMTDNNELWLQRVRYTAAEPTSWLNHARTLRQAAEDLWVAGNYHDCNPGTELGSTVLTSWQSPEYLHEDTGGSTGDVCFMLFGFALENLTKAIIVCCDPNKVKANKWLGRGHDLVKLFDLSELPVTDLERDLLQRVTRIIEWKGRYPVPLDFNEVGAQDRVIGYLAISNIWPADDYKLLCQLYEKTKAVLLETIKSIPPIPSDFDFS